MNKDELSIKNELTISKILKKLIDKNITEENLDDKLTEKFGINYQYSKLLNKTDDESKKSTKEYIKNMDFNTSSDDLSVDELTRFFNSKNSDFFKTNEAYKQLSTLDNSDFNSLVDNIEKTRFDIFLSHSMKDKYIVYGTYLILTEDLGYTVYVDWIVDPFLSQSRSHVAKRNIRILQIRMRSSFNLNLLKTLNYSISKWIAWELGYFNGRSNQVYIQKIHGKEFDDDKSGMGFLKIYNELFMYKDELVYLDRGKITRIN
ncbi:MAG: hypothetical protein KQ78_00211 [Candidatus Izimaplasma bacterium HR2]|nr:MAG: hypothetical protein KQ78_00211 [Candidatus Izimaplasma bacterium HR2]